MENSQKRTEYALRKLSRKRFGSSNWRSAGPELLHHELHQSTQPHALRPHRLRNIIPIPGFQNWQFIETPRIFAVRAKHGASRRSNPTERKAYRFFDVIRGVANQIGLRELRQDHGVVYREGFLVVSKKRHDSALWRIASAWIQRFRLFRADTTPTDRKRIIGNCQFIFNEYSTRESIVPHRLGGFKVEYLRKAAMLVGLNY